MDIDYFESYNKNILLYNIICEKSLFLIDVIDSYNDFIVNESKKNSNISNNNIKNNKKTPLFKSIIENIVKISDTIEEMTITLFYKTKNKILPRQIYITKYDDVTICDMKELKNNIGSIFSMINIPFNARDNIKTLSSNILSTIESSKLFKHFKSKKNISKNNMTKVETEKIKSGVKDAQSISKTISITSKQMLLTVSDDTPNIFKKVLNSFKYIGINISNFIRSVGSKLIGSKNND